LNEEVSGKPLRKMSPERPRWSFRHARISSNDDLPHPVGPKHVWNELKLL